jgi:hypothetical protein
MNEFKFSCPNCRQNIQATPEYSGAQINCPSCQTLLVVPPAPGGVPPPPHANKLSMAAATPSHEAAPAPPSKGPPVRKKKDHKNLIVGSVVAAGVIAAGIYFGPPLYAKYFHHEEAPAPAPAAEAAAAATSTNEPPAPPPELTTEDILQKVADTYAGLNSFAIKGQSVAAIDASALNPAAAGVQRSTATVTLQLGRTNFYRMEWERTVAGKVVKGAAWDSGKGDFVGFGQNAPGKVKNRQAALDTASGSSAALCTLIAEMFFGDTNNLTTRAEAFARTNGPAINGQSCYILNGELNAHNVVLWVNKTSFLIPQIEFDFGGKLDMLILKKLPTPEREKLTRMSKLKGNVVETYQNMETNLNLTASAFETTYIPSAPTPGRGGRPRGEPPGRGTATQITRRVMQPQPQPQ